MKFANSLKKRMPTGRQAVIGVPFLWLFLFFLLPFAIVLKISLAEADVAIPPYTEIFAYADQQLQVLLNLGNYLMLTDDPLYIDAYLGSLKMAFISTLICLLVGYPMAYAIARSSQSSQTVLLLPISCAMATNNSSSDRPVITSGITSGAVTMPPNSVRPRKRGMRVRTKAARVPRSTEENAV